MLKNIIKKITPPIFTTIYKSIKIKIIENRNPIFTSIKYITKKSENLFILGNGPSLSTSLLKYENIFSENDLLVVNFFCKSDYYTKLKPRFYLVCDPIFFIDDNLLSETVLKQKNTFWETFLNKTTWEITFITNSCYRNEKTLLNIQSLSKNINFVFLNTHNTFIPKNKLELYKGLDNNSLLLPVTTVLNCAVYIGIFLRYHKLFLFGADTTWIEQLKIDQTNNMLYTISKHFYGEEKKQIFEDDEGTIPAKLHQELHAIARDLESYHSLKEYADYAEVEVINSSEYSLIDAFNRGKPNTD